MLGNEDFVFTVIGIFQTELDDSFDLSAFLKNLLCSSFKIT